MRIKQNNKQFMCMVKNGGLREWSADDNFIIALQDVCIIMSEKCDAGFKCNEKKIEDRF